MKAKKHVIILSMLFINLTVFGQQIGSGFPTGNIDNFNIEMPSGFYQGNNAAGQVDGGGWNHLLNLRHSYTGNNHQLQIASSYTENDRLFFRKFARNSLGVANPAPVWNEMATRGTNTFTGNQIINGFLGVGLTRIPEHKLEVEGDHLSSRFLLRANNGSNADANLMLWASEPGVTYSGVGIGNNVHNWKNSVGKISLLNTTRGGSYIRLLDNEMRFNVMSSSGVDTQAIAINSAGNIGIGTTSPTAKLDVNGDIKASGTIIASPATTSNQVVVKSQLDALGASLGLGKVYNTNTLGNNINFNTLVYDRSILLQTQPLHSPNFTGQTNMPKNDYGQLLTFGSIDGLFPSQLAFTQAGELFYRTKYITTNVFSIDAAWVKIATIGNNTSNYIPRFSNDVKGILINSSVFDNGTNVGIGTTDPKNKLSVNGTIWAKEVKVSLTDAADWVFDTNYKLKPLADVEKYIYENKHLPEIPSAEEFRQKDMNVSEMSNKLLQKIEELTLYAIEQQKELDRLKTENENYKSLSERLSAIEKELKK